MPLIPSNSRDAIGQNIKAEQDAGKPRAQSIAIALSVARKNGGYPAKRRGAKKKGV